MSKAVDIFPETEWSMVLDAASSDPERVREGVRRLCECYHPVIRRWFQSQASYQDAEDLTQEFLLKFLGVGGGGDPTLYFCRGSARFRNFLSTSLANFRNQSLRKASAQKRGGGIPHCGFDEGGVIAVDQGRPPSIDLDLDLAREVHRRAVIVAVSRFSPSTAGGAASELALCIQAPGSPPDYTEMSARLGVSIDALRTTLMRLRRSYHEAFRSQVTKFTPRDEVAEEHFHLVTLLAAHDVSDRSAERGQQPLGNS